MSKTLGVEAGPDLHDPTKDEYFAERRFYMTDGSHRMTVTEFCNSKHDPNDSLEWPLITHYPELRLTDLDTENPADRLLILSFSQRC